MHEKILASILIRAQPLRCTLALLKLSRRILVGCMRGMIGCTIQIPGSHKALQVSIYTITTTSFQTMQCTMRDFSPSYIIFCTPTTSPDVRLNRSMSGGEFGYNQGRNRRK
jgi:hypothetical protein